MSDYLLSPKELAQLKQTHRVAKSKKDADKLKTVYLLGSGWSIPDVCEALLLSDDTVRSYFSRYQSGGTKELLKNKHIGRASQLTLVEMQALAQHLDEHTFTRVSDIIGYVEAEFEVVYSDSGMRRLLQQLGFVYKKPEKVPHRVDEGAQKNFIRSYKKLKKCLKKGDHIYFMDATHPEHTPVPAYGWIKRGTTKVVKSNPRPYRLNINGAININNLDVSVSFSQKINKETIMDFLELLRKQQPKGWIYLICDNAGYYQSPEVQRLAKAMAIKLIYLPAYSPNLNLIERLWKFFKKQVLYNHYYPEFSQMKEAAKRFFKEIGSHKDKLKTLMTENFQIISV